MAESAAIREKRLELQELETGKVFWGDSYPVMRQALLDDLAELGATVTPAPERPTQPPIRLSSPKKPQLAQAQEVPEPAAAVAVQAEPKAKKIQHAGRKPMEPRAKLAKMLLDLAALTEPGNVQDNKRYEIRKHCKVHGLEVPESCAKKPMGNPIWRATKAQKGSPIDTAIRVIQSIAAPTEQANPEDLVRVSYDEGKPTEPSDAPIHHSAAASLRALRSQALDLLPRLEDLTTEGARACREEMDLLAETLVLGGHLINRRTA